MDTTFETPEVQAARIAAENAQATFKAAQEAVRAAEAQAREAQREAADTARQTREKAVLLSLAEELATNFAPAVNASYDAPVDALSGTWGMEASISLISEDKGRLVTVSLNGKRVKVVCHVGASYDTATFRFPRHKDGSYNWDKVNAQAIAGVRARMSALAAKNNRTNAETRFLFKAEATLNDLARAFPELESHISNQHSAPGGKHYRSQACCATLHNDRFSVTLRMVGADAEQRVNVEVNGNMGDGDGLLSALVKMTAQMIDGSE